MDKEITILFEDDTLVVINKPAGILTHDNGHSTDPSVVDWFLTHSPESKGVGEESVNNEGTPLERSGIVHRLDRDTSGVMVLAKTQAAHEWLKLQFHDRLVKKEYRAFVYGHMNEKWGSINRPMGRSSKDFRLWSAQRGAKGNLREAITDWELIGQGEFNDESFSYLKLKPKTGRTHQLRVHMKAVDRPIIGDILYAGARQEQSNNLELERLALHAHILEIVLPDSQPHRFIAPVPLEFEVAADHLHDEVEEY